MGKLVCAVICLIVGIYMLLLFTFADVIEVKFNKTYKVSMWLNSMGIPHLIEILGLITYFMLEIFGGR